MLDKSSIPDIAGPPAKRPQTNRKGCGRRAASYPYPLTIGAFPLNTGGGHSSKALVLVVQDAVYVNLGEERRFA